MAEFKSDQFTNFDAGGQEVNVNEWGGRVRMAYFSVPAIAGLAQDDTVKLAKVPAKARVLRGWLEHGAYGASVTLDIGITGTEDKYLAALDISAAGEADWAHTRVLNTGKATGTTEETLVAKFEGANPSDTATLSGWLEYVID